MCIEDALKQFTGLIKQIPSMYSALKHKGQPLYKYARQGITIEREPRDIMIYSLTMLDFNEDVCVLKVRCSKGTYVRTLVEDIGDVLGCGAHVSALRRLSTGSYKSEAMITLEQLETTFEHDGFSGLDKINVITLKRG